MLHASSARDLAAEAASQPALSRARASYSTASSSTASSSTSCAPSSQAEVAISGRGRHLGQQELGELHTALREPDVDLGCVELLLRVRLCRRDAER